MADVYAALAYYWDHQNEIEDAIQKERSLAEELRAKVASPLMEKLRRRIG